MSQNYLFGNALDFYEKCKRLGYICTYPPPTFLIDAAWLYPFKLLGLIPGQDKLPLYLAYWLKALTTAVYIVSGVIFYWVSLEYFGNKAWARYSAAAWLTAPLALFSQLIFSQQDIFYVLLTIAGFLLFLRGHLNWASLVFGSAITFKYFPLFVFAPLLLFHEKRVRRILVCVLLFALPISIITVTYGHSPAFLEHRSILLERIYAASLDTGYFGFWRVYLLLASFVVVCGLAYFTDAAREERASVAAYIWLAASVSPFGLLFWNPQWMMFVVPAIVLTSMISEKAERFLLLDFVGMFMFVATVSLSFQNNVDAAMFRGEWLGLELRNTFLMARLFSWFGDQSRNVFLSGFCGYLTLQVILKYRQLLHHREETRNCGIDYGNIRWNLYAGLMPFLIPAFVAIYGDLTSTQSIIRNEVSVENQYELVSGRRFEQSFVAQGRAITQVRLLLSTSGRMASDDILVEIIDKDGVRLGGTSETVAASHEFGWHEFIFQPIPVSAGTRYSFRVKSSGGWPGNAFTLLASSGDSDKEGAAIIEGASQKLNFAFEIVLER